MARPSVGTLIPVGAVGTAEAGDVLTGKTFSSEPAGVGAEGSMPNRGAYNITPGTSSVAIPAGYHNGSGYVASLGGNATAGDVLSGKTFSSDSAGRNRSGSMPNQGAMVITPGTTNIAIPAGYHNGMGRVNGDVNLVPGNIKQGVSIFGVTGTLTSTAQINGWNNWGYTDFEWESGSSSNPVYTEWAYIDGPIIITQVYYLIQGHYDGKYDALQVRADNGPILSFEIKEARQSGYTHEYNPGAKPMGIIALNRMDVRCYHRNNSAITYPLAIRLSWRKP